MKEFDKVFKDMEKAFEDTDRAFKKVDADMDHVFKRMDKIFEEMENITNVARKREVGRWKEWYAWRPVKIKGKSIWLKKVYRRSINTYVDHDNWTRYEYGDIFDVLKEAGEK